MVIGFSRSLSHDELILGSGWRSVAAEGFGNRSRYWAAPSQASHLVFSTTAAHWKSPLAALILDIYRVEAMGDLTQRGAYTRRASAFL